MRNIKPIRVIKKFLLIIAVCILCSFFIPIKIAFNAIESISDESCLIVRQISSGSTEGRLWLCIGDSNGIYTNDGYIVELYGKVPQDVLSSDIYDNGETTFVIYGSVNNNKLDIDDINFINYRGWDFIGNISRDSESLRLPFKNYITIYDLKFFDFMLSGND